MSLDADVAALREAMDQSVDAWSRQLTVVAGKARRRTVAVLSAAVEQMVPLLDDVGGVFIRNAGLASMLVDLGGSPLPLREVMPRLTAQTLEYRAGFPQVWAATGRPLPDARRRPSMAAIQSMLRTATPGLSQADAIHYAAAWLYLTDVVRPMNRLMGHRDFRRAMSHRDRLRDAAAAVADQDEGARWLHGLTLVFDQEPLIVLDRDTRRGFALTASGIGDNYQLHTLLADRLIGRGRLPGQRPDKSWVAAASTGKQQTVSLAHPIVRRFRLYDGLGAHINIDGWPADIPTIEGVRVIVLLPPDGVRGWNAGRAYPHMPPTLTVDRELSRAEADNWWQHVTPVREVSLLDELSGKPPAPTQ